MNYEKAYKEALKRASKLRVQNQFDTVSQMMEHIFPELGESEDERIRKEIYKYFRDLQLSSDREFSPSISIDEILDWLEKQGEQKPAWSEEDEKTLNNIIEEIEPFGECPDYPTDEDREYYYGRTKMIDWLKSVKYRIKGE